jgi:hypothetical protein
LIFVYYWLRTLATNGQEAPMVDSRSMEPLALAMNTDASRLGNLSTSLSSASNTDGQLTAWSLAVA